MTRIIRCWFLLPVLAFAAPQAEPTNAQELAAKKAEAQRRTAEAYARWKASLTPAQQAWETLLEQNLGSFYLPLHQADKVAGRSNAWDYVEDDPRLPRVLLIGDSISRGYTQAVRQAMAGRANIHRAPENCGPTANGLKKLPIWLGHGRWDIIHFNFGIHDRKTPPADYEQRLEAIVDQLKKTGARLIWAATTPVAEGGMKDAAPADLVVRNEIAARVMQKHGVTINDLYAWILPDLATYQNPNDVHFSAAGYTRLAEQVANALTQAIPLLPRVNTALIPVGRLEKDSYDWQRRHEEIMAIKDKVNPEIVLIGDSITHFWGGQPDAGKPGNRGTESWNELFGQRRVLNLGFGWDRTQNVLQRLELGELDGLRPKAVILHIGTNNLAQTVNARSNTAVEIAEAIGLIVERVQGRCPGVKVIVMAIFPRGPKADDPKRAILNDINQRLAPLGQREGVTFLDITNQWLLPDGSIPKDLMPDFLHPNEKGYAVWAEALKAVMPK